MSSTTNVQIYCRDLSGALSQLPAAASQLLLWLGSLMTLLFRNNSQMENHMKGARAPDVRVIFSFHLGLREGRSWQ